MTSTTIQINADTTSADLVAAYASADASGKARIRNRLQEVRNAAAMALDVPLLGHLNGLATALESAKGTAPKAAPDYAATIAQRAADLYAAADMLVRGLVVPDGMPEGTAYDARPLPEPSAAARTIAAAKVTRSTERNDIAGAILRATAANRGQWLTMREVANSQGLPSDGAVAARLFPKVTVDGVEVRGTGKPGSPRQVRMA